MAYDGVTAAYEKRAMLGVLRSTETGTMTDSALAQGL